MSRDAVGHQDYCSITQRETRYDAESFVRLLTDLEGDLILEDVGGVFVVRQSPVGAAVLSHLLFECASPVASRSLGLAFCQGLVCHSS